MDRDWRLLVLGATAAGLVTASSFYLGYRFGKYRARFQPLQIGRLWEEL